jgi:hypothetical protein
VGEALSPQRRDRSGSGFWFGLAVAALALAGFGWLIVRAQALPTTVVPIAWDKEACAHCRMQVGERGFAAQLQLDDGRVLNFDDPGCLFGWLKEHSDKVHATWLHHRTDERWLRRDEVRFIEASPTPMGYGIAAVDASTPLAMRWEQAAQKVQAAR